MIPKLTDVVDSRGRIRVVEIEADTIGSSEVLAAVPGLTYRMLDYWRRRGGHPTEQRLHRRERALAPLDATRDVLRLRALVAVNQVMRQGAFSAPTDLLGVVWDALAFEDTFTVEGPHVSLVVRLFPR